MIRLLDTSVVIDAARGRPPGVARHLEQLSPEDVAISSITVAELWYGIARSAHPEAKRALWSRFIEPLVILPFDRAAAEIHGELRHQLWDEPMGARDLLIAAIAVANDLVLVTGNVREFRRVPDLRVENSADW